jgi:DNA polymerase III subunit delta'
VFPFRSRIDCYMFFKDIPGHAEVKSQLIRAYHENKVSHSLLFLGSEGCGGLPMALAFARFMLCEGDKKDDACGQCVACRKTEGWVHPDLHFTYPVIPKKSGEQPVSTNYIVEWRKALKENPFMGLNDWLQQLNAENKQGNIYAKECREISRQLGLKSYESASKIQIIWKAELLKKEGNRLLKIIEEPPENTYFFLVAEHVEEILSTILSRTQIIKLNKLQDDDIVNFLIENKDISENKAWNIAHLSDGNLNAALNLSDNPVEQQNELFGQWMKLILRNNIPGLKKWVGDMATIGRENQKQFLLFVLHYFREAMMQANVPGYKPRIQEKDLKGVAYIAGKFDFEVIENIISLVENTHYYIQRNANAKIQFMHLSLEMIDYLLLQKTTPAKRVTI